MSFAIDAYDLAVFNFQKIAEEDNKNRRNGKNFNPTVNDFQQTSFYQENCSENVKDLIAIHDNKNLLDQITSDIAESLRTVYWDDSKSQEVNESFSNLYKPVLLESDIKITKTVKQESSNIDNTDYTATKYFILSVGNDHSISSSVSTDTNNWRFHADSSAIENANNISRSCVYPYYYCGDINDDQRYWCKNDDTTRKVLNNHMSAIATSLNNDDNLNYNFNVQPITSAIINELNEEIVGEYFHNKLIETRNLPLLTITKTLTDVSAEDAATIDSLADLFGYNLMTAEEIARKKANIIQGKIDEANKKLAELEQESTDADTAMIVTANTQNEKERALDMERSEKTAAETVLENAQQTLENIRVQYNLDTLEESVATAQTTLAQETEEFDNAERLFTEARTAKENAETEKANIDAMLQEWNVLKDQYQNELNSANAIITQQENIILSLQTSTDSSSTDAIGSTA